MCQKCLSYFFSVGQKAASSILCQSLSGIPLEPCTFSRNTHPAIWCLTKVEYNGMSFNLISQQCLCLIFLIVQVQETLTILQYCIHLYRNLSMVLHSQLDTSLAFRCIFFLSFCRDKYNWPEKIRCCGRYLWLNSGDIIIRGTGMQIQYNYVLNRALFLENVFQLFYAYE